MEAFAARQIEKKKARQLKSQAEEKLLREDVKSMDQKQQEELNLFFGYPDPPQDVNALGKHESAAVWWRWEKSSPDEEDPIGWEIARYRRLPGDPEDTWSKKGQEIVGPLDDMQKIIENLTNGFLYRFTVKTRNSKGFSRESEPSPEVIVEPPLPAGWFRFYDDRTRRFYYANLKSHQTTWTRPEADPYFLEESVVSNFTKRELDALKALFDEEIVNFSYVHVDRFPDILIEMGERVIPTADMVKLFRGFAGDEAKLETWTDFMNIISHLKEQKTKVKVFLDTAAKKAAAPSIKPTRQTKIFANWKMDYSSLADRRYFRNLITGEIRWDMPSEIRFYMPKQMEDKLLKLFTYEQLETIKQYFCALNVDGTGELAEKDLRLLFVALNIPVDDKLLKRLMKTVDTDQNGTIEFSEFCWMVHELCRQGDDSSDWHEFRVLLGQKLKGNRKRRKEATALTASPKKDAARRGSVAVAGTITLDLFSAAIAKINQESFNATQSSKVQALAQERAKMLRSHSSTGGILSQLLRLLSAGLFGRKKITPFYPHGPHCFCGCRKALRGGISTTTL